MFIRQYFQNENGTRRAYWALVESYRSHSGPRQRVVAWLGKLDEAGRLGVQQAAEGTQPSSCRGFVQRTLFDNESSETSPVEPRWVEVDAAAVRVENVRHFGGPWLALELIRRVQLDKFLGRVMRRGREHVAWFRSALILVIARLLEPSSELHIAEHISHKKLVLVQKCEFCMTMVLA